MAPVWFGGRLQGAIGLTHRSDGRRLDMDGLARLGRFAELVGRALAHTDGRELSVADPQPEIDGLVAALERTVPGSARHGEEVALIARRLAEELGAGEADLLELGLAARLSRVGRIRMPAHAAGPAAASTDAGLELLRLEPLWGADMVARVPGLEAVALIVRHTWERWDGRGHPDGLAGERIPLASRLIAAARCFAPARPSSSSPAPPSTRSSPPGSQSLCSPRPPDRRDRTPGRLPSLGEWRFSSCSGSWQAQPPRCLRACCRCCPWRCRRGAPAAGGARSAW
jgi:hypothetical protein